MMNYTTTQIIKRLNCHTREKSVSDKLGLHISDVQTLRRDNAPTSFYSVSQSEKSDFLTAILVGKIENNLTASSQLLHATPISFTDNSGSIPCHIPIHILTPTLMNKMVIIHEWSFIKRPSGDDCYIEIHKMVPLNEETEVSTAPRKIFCVEDACLLLLNREKIGYNRLINVCGLVSAVSEFMKVRSDPAFFVWLTDDDNSTQVLFLCREKCLLHWRTMIHTQEKYVFTNVSLTTLCQGNKDELKLLLATDCSQLHLASELQHGSGILNIISLKHCLREQGGELTENFNWTLPECFSQPSNNGTITFEGRITNADRANVGIFDLDQTVRVYLHRTMEVMSYDHLRVGTKVVLDNVHLVRTPKISKVRLYCCFYGCINVVEFPHGPVVQSNPSFSNETAKLVRKLERDLCSSLDQIECILLSIETVSRQFCPGILQSLNVKLLQKSFYYKISETNPPIERNETKSPILEFISSDHNMRCNGGSASGDPFQFSTIRELLEMLQEEMAKEKEPRADDWNSSSYWKHCNIPSGSLKTRRLILAVLISNRKSGRLQLLDQTGVIDCVVTEKSSNFSKCRHNCSDSVCQRDSCDSVASTQHPTCPYPQTWLLGGLFRIDCFNLIGESFKQSCDSDVRIQRFYVQFSMTDAVLLENIQKFSPMNCIMGNDHGKRDLDLSECSISSKRKFDSVVEPHNKMLIVSDGTRKFVSSDPSAAHDSTKHRNLSAARDSTNRNESCTCSISQHFIVLHKDHLKTVTRFPNCIVTFSVQAYLVGDPVRKRCRHCEPTTRTNFSAKENRKKTNECQNKKIFVFRGDALAWYPVLHLGCIYRITRSGPHREDYFDGENFEPSIMKDYKDRLKAEKLVVIEGPVGLVRIPQLKNGRSDSSDTPTNQIEGQPLADRSIDEILREVHLNAKMANSVLDETSVSSAAVGSASELVSCSGVVVKKMFKDSQYTSFYRPAPDIAVNEKTLEKLGISVPQNLNMHLIVRDLLSNDESSIYVNLEQLQYPLGLLVGSIVRFEGLERKISRDDRPYLRYHVTSSCFLVAAADADAVQTRNLHDLQTAAPVFLCQLYEGPAKTDVFFVNCRITKVLKVALEHSCPNHGTYAVGHDGVCSRCDAFTRFKSYASFLIDDGSGTAFVSCRGDQVASVLALDSRQQWSELKDLVRNIGRVNYEMRGGREFEGSMVELFVQKLCDSALVKREVKLFARRYRTMIRSDGKKIANLKDFKSDVQYETLSWNDTPTSSSIQLEFVDLSEISSVESCRSLLQQHKSSLSKS